MIYLIVVLSVSAITGIIYNNNDATNSILENSAISLRYRVVGIAKVADSFVEPTGTSAYNTLLHWVTFTDGNLDEAQTYRNSFAADHVGLVSSTASFANQACGIGWINPGFSDGYAYTLYSVSCLIGGIDYAHEIGHTMGCQHDRYNAAAYAAANPTFFGFGDCWEDAAKNDCTCYSSVMVYICNTPQNHCTQCNRKPFMSNPNVIDSGNPTGENNAACALQIHNNRYLPIAYRKSIQPGGMLFAVSPTSAVYSTCYIANVTGWQLLQNLSDVPTVTVNGFTAHVISYDINSVVVRTPVLWTFFRGERGRDRNFFWKSDNATKCVLFHLSAQYLHRDVLRSLPGRY